MLTLQEDFEKAQQLYFTAVEQRAHAGRDDSDEGKRAEAAAWLGWGRLCAALRDKKRAELARAQHSATVVAEYVRPWRQPALLDIFRRSASACDGLRRVATSAV